MDVLVQYRTFDTVLLLERVRKGCVCDCIIHYACRKLTFWYLFTCESQRSISFIKAPQAIPNTIRTTDSGTLKNGIH
jgi:hypothetical protein